MILELLIYLLASLLAIIVIHAAIRIVQVHLAYIKYKKALNGLPILPETWSPGGHMHQVLFDPYSCMKIESLHRFYGKTFGWLYGNLPMAMTVDVDLIKKIIYDDPNLNINKQKFSVPIKELEFDSLVLAEDDQWRRIRKAIAPSFTSHKIKTKNVQEEIDNVIGHLIDSFEEKLKKSSQATGDSTKASFELNADDSMSRYSTDLIFSCFYKQYNLIDYSGKRDYYSHLIEGGLADFFNPVVEFTATLPIVRPVIDFLILNFHSIGVGRRVVMDFIKKQTQLNLMARKEMIAAKARASAAGSNFDPDNFLFDNGTRFKRNMIDAFIDNFHDGKISKSEYLNSSFFLFLAGIKTSADALSRLFYHLASNPDIQDKLRASIMKEGQESEYLGWCINESLRLDSPAPSGCPRKLERDIHVEGGVMPKGTFVFTPSYAIHRMPEYWGQDAGVYRPERWQESEKFHPMQFIPFGSGRRGCPGREFAFFEMRKLLTELMTRYKFERCDKTSDSMFFKSPYLVYTIYDIPTWVKVSRLSRD